MRLNIKEAREKAGLTQDELSERLGYTQNALSGWERGIREPKLDTIVRIADICGVSIDYLFGREGTKIETFGEHTTEDQQHDLAEGLKVLGDSTEDKYVGFNVKWDTDRLPEDSPLRGAVEEIVRQVLVDMLKVGH